MSMTVDARTTPKVQPVQPLPPGSTQIFGSVFLEVVLPTPRCVLTLNGWRLRWWPVARLGDATLEALPLHPDLRIGDLLEALRQMGAEPLEAPAMKQHNPPAPEVNIHFGYKPRQWGERTGDMTVTSVMTAGDGCLLA